MVEEPNRNAYQPGHMVERMCEQKGLVIRAGVKNYLRIYIL
jgi:hypothetical protein